jgi:hypothetical protein
MTEAEFLDQLSAWALGGLDAGEAAGMEQYVSEHPEIRVEVKRAFTTAAALGQALPSSAPPPGAWRRLEAALPADGDMAGRTATKPAPRRRWTAVAWAVAAAAAIIAIWLWRDRDARIGREATLARELSELRGRDVLVDETVALLELAGTQIIPLEPTSPDLKVAANAVYHRGVKRAYVVVKGLPADAAGYRIWVNRAGQRLEAGRMAVDREGGVIASVAANSLDDVPESFEITRDNGAVVLQSRVKI